MAAAALALRHRPRWLAAFGLGAAPMLALTLFVYFGSVRHHAQPFLWFLACAWLAGGLRRSAEPVLVGVLALQALAGALLLAADHARPFSSARAAAAWLERPEHADLLLVGSIDFAAQPIAAWTRRPFYYPEQQRFGTFMDWGPSRHTVPMSRVLSDAVELSRRESRSVALVLSKLPYQVEVGEQVDAATRRPCALRSRGFLGAIVPHENYHVFLLDRQRER